MHAKRSTQVRAVGPPCVDDNQNDVHVCVVCQYVGCSSAPTKKKPPPNRPPGHYIGYSHARCIQTTRARTPHNKRTNVRGARVACACVCVSDACVSCRRRGHTDTTHTQTFNEEEHTEEHRLCNLCSIFFFFAGAAHVAIYILCSYITAATPSTSPPPHKACNNNNVFMCSCVCVCGKNMTTQRKMAF